MTRERREWGFDHCSRGCYCPPPGPLGTHLSCLLVISCIKMLGPRHRTGSRCWGIEGLGKALNQWQTRWWMSTASPLPIKWDDSQACYNHLQRFQGIEPQLPRVHLNSCLLFLVSIPHSLAGVFWIASQINYWACIWFHVLLLRKPNSESLLRLAGARVLAKFCYNLLCDSPLSSYLSFVVLNKGAQRFEFI